MHEDGLRGGLIGCGFFAQNHLNAWRDLENATLVAVCDLDEAKAARPGIKGDDAATRCARDISWW